MSAPPATTGGAGPRLDVLEGRLGRRAVWGLALLMVLAHAGLGWVRRPVGVTTMQDDARYLLLSRALADLEYEDRFLVEEAPHGKYPPGYPALLAAWDLAGGRDRGYGWLVLPSLALSAAALGLVFAVLRRRWSAGFALVSLGVLFAHPLLVERAGYLVSEPLYLALSMTVLWAAAGTVGGYGARMAAAAGAAAIGAALTRSIGVAALAALGTHWLLGRRYRAFLLLTGAAAVTVGLWLLWSAGVSNAHSGSYIGAVAAGGEGTELLHRVAVRLIRKADVYLDGLRDYLPLPVPGIGGTLVDNGAAVVLGVAALVPGVVLLWSRWRVAALYLGFYALALLAWPFNRVRFVEPLLPLLVPAFLLGVGWLAARVRRGWSGPAVALAALAMFTSGATTTARGIARAAGCPKLPLFPATSALTASRPCLVPDQEAYFAAVAWARDSVPLGAVFFTLLPEPLYLYAGHRSVAPSHVSETGEEGIVDALRREGVTHVLLSRLRRAELWDAGPRLARDCRSLELLASFPPHAHLFRVTEAGAEGDGGAACRELADYLRLNAEGDVAPWLR